MLSAPAQIPAITLVSLSVGVHPAEATLVVAPSATLSAISSESPACSASAITGATRAHDTRLGSSKPTRARVQSWDSRTDSASWVRQDLDFDNPDSLSAAGTLFTFPYPPRRPKV